MPGPLFLPAMQARFGDWTYYAALVALSDIEERVGYATPLSENASLADQIQRRLDDTGRAQDIADYLTRNADRFFNALVVGVLGGQPEWHPFILSSRIPEHEMGDVTERDQDLVGYLELSGTETLFALDGQHRLAGIRKALIRDPSLGREKLALIFVPHVDTPEGLIRTRSLFISLNKKAVPVKRKDIIILDEVDLAAIITRRLVDHDARFKRGVIDVDRFGAAIPANSTFWTTIGTFYDVNNILIRQIVEGRDEEELKDAAKVRLPEERIAFYEAGVVDFYERVAMIEPFLQSVFGAAPAERIEAIQRARTAADPRLLARPIGLKVFARAAAELRKSQSLDEALQELRRVPLTMDQAPFADDIWDTQRSRMLVSGQSLASRLLLYMLGLMPFDHRLRASLAELRGILPSDVSPPALLPPFP
ncbi:MAG TPA: DNA sulfur modification protein DndB [Devosia sp.]|jgi:DNA sulfur modification protein DndB